MQPLAQIANRMQNDESGKYRGQIYISMSRELVYANEMKAKLVASVRGDKKISPVEKIER